MLSSRSWLSLLGELRQLESKMSNSSMPLSRPSVQLQMELSSDWSLASPSSTAHNHYTYTFLTLTTNTFNHYDESVISAAVKKSTYRTQTDIKWILGKVLSVQGHPAAEVSLDSNNSQRCTWRCLSDDRVTQINLKRGQAAYFHQCTDMHPVFKFVVSTVL